MKSKRRKELVTIVAPKVIFQENVTRRNKIGRTKSFSQVFTTIKIELLMIILSIYNL
jgi:hypothetical protein